jgi:hypothetical protein
VILYTFMCDGFFYCFGFGSAYVFSCLYGIKGVRLLDFIVYCPAGRALRGLIEALLRISRDLNEPGGSFKKFSPLPPAGTTAVLVYTKRNTVGIGFDSSWVSALPAARWDCFGH